MRERVYLLPMGGSDKILRVGDIETGGIVVIQTVENAHGAMVALGLERYADLTDEVEFKLDEADIAAALSDRYLTHDEVFAKYKRSV